MKPLSLACSDVNMSSRSLRSVSWCEFESRRSDVRLKKYAVCLTQFFVFVWPINSELIQQFDQDNTEILLRQTHSCSTHKSGIQICAEHIIDRQWIELLLCCLFMWKQLFGILCYSQKSIIYQKNVSTRRIVFCE